MRSEKHKERQETYKNIKDEITLTLGRQVVIIERDGGGERREIVKRGSEEMRRGESYI